MISWQFLREQFECGVAKFPLLQHIIIEIPEEKSKEWNQHNPMPGTEADGILKYFENVQSYWGSSFIYHLTPNTMLMDMICERQYSSLKREEAFYQFKTLAEKAGEFYGNSQKIKVENRLILWLIAVHKMAKPERRVLEANGLFSRRVMQREVCYAMIEDLFYESALLCDVLAKAETEQDTTPAKRREIRALVWLKELYGLTIERAFKAYLDKYG